jgi:predicted DNA-binding transcriptional regulator AlpA
MASSTLPPETAAPGAAPPRRFLDAKQVGARLCCSWRHVLRMADRGLMPWGVKLGALRRWDADELELWIKNGCKPCRTTGKG